MSFFSSFILGLLTPLSAVCVLPLYPAFLSYLTHKLNPDDEKSTKTLSILFGLVATFGVIVFMTLLGLVFTTILKISLTNVINIISPIAFGFLGVISILLIFNVDIGSFLPKIKGPKTKKNPLWSAFVFGFSFGPIIIPCNPGLIAAFFTTSLTRSASTVATNMIHFLLFGIGIGFPLLVLSALSSTWSGAIIGFMTKYKRYINLVSGIIMLGISIYYLVFVFHIFG